MKWIVLEVPAPPRGEEHLLVDALRRLGARAVEREGERYVAHLPVAGRVDRLLREAELAVRASTSLRDPGITWRPQERAPWAEPADLPPRRVSERIVVAAAGIGPEAPPGAVVVRLHPGVAFGTAEHPTTVACLRLLDRLVEPGTCVADIGAGSGVLAIAAALLGAGRVAALELDPLSCEAMRRNLDASGVGDRVEVREAAATDAELVGLGPFDGIVANIERAVLLPLVPALARSLRPGGWLVLSGIIRPERDEMRAAALAAGLLARDEAVEAGWWTGWFRAAPSGGR